MRFQPMRHDAEAKLALVRRHRLHEGRFTDDAEPRLHRRVLQDVEQAAHADAADLLVIGKGEIDRRVQRSLHGAFGHGEAAGDEALHVRRAAPIDGAIARDHLERVRRPGLAFDGNDIRMPGQHHARLVRGTDRRPEIGFPAILVVHDQAVDPQLPQRLLDIGDQIEIAVAADRGIRNEFFEMVERCGHAQSIACDNL